MANRGFPQTQLDDIEPSAVQEIVSSLKQLHDKGRPKTDLEVQQRIDDYFAFCEESSIRPGIESLSMALHISRESFYRWAHGENCSQERAELIQSAKAFIAAYLEQCLLQGKVPVPSGIFLAKNWLGYKDTLSVEENLPTEQNRHILTASELPKYRNEDV